jgi:hypothetical protein
MSKKEKGKWGKKIIQVRKDFILSSGVLLS